MARGFESKDVEFQQAEAERKAAPRPAQSAAEREQAMARRTIELALADVRRQRESAQADAHRRMLESAIEDLEQQLVALRRQG